MKSYIKKLGVTLLPFVTACSIQAITISPTSYSFDISPSGSYSDSTGMELIDGVDGSDPWNTSISPWVGWQRTNPTITFLFDSVVTINTVSIEVQGNGAGAIYRPSSVQIGSGAEAVAFAVADIRTPAVLYLDFNGSWTGSSLAVKLNYRSEWIFVDEVKFSVNETSSANGVPDAGSTALLLAAGIAGLATIRRFSSRK